jgi:ATP/maltotriose-dependent transcriptional regulator MalT
VPSEQLWERERQLAAADACIAAARQGRGGATFVLGDAGLGKTALLAEIGRRAGEAGDALDVVRARCDPMETSLAFGLLAQIGHGLGGGDLPWSEPAVPGEDRAAVLYRTLRWLAAAAHGPVLVTIDDLQWADPDSLDVLGFVCRRLAGLPVAVVASLRGRPTAAADLARTLVNRGDAGLEHLAPLTERAAVALLAQRQSDPLPAGAASRAWHVSGGNPLLLGLAAADGTGRQSSGGGAVPVDQRSLVLGRFSGLSADGTSWARAASVLGIGFRPELVGELAGLDIAAGESAAEELWHSGLARDRADGTGEFVHPLFAQLLYEDLAPPVRTRLHARAFAALATRRLDDAAAEHAVRGNLVGDEHAVAVLTRTGRRAFRAGAPATAASRLEAAVRLSGDDPAADLLAELGRAQLEAGRLGEAAATITRALETGPPVATRVQALTTLSTVHFSLGEFDRADAALQQAVALAEDECPDAVVLPLCNQATVVLMTAGPAAALPIAARAVEFARGGEPRLQAQARATWGMLAYWCGDPAGLDAAEAEGRRLLGKTPADLADDLRAGASGILVPFAGTASLAGRFEDAEAAFRAGIDAAEQIGAVNAAAGLGIAYGLMLSRTRVGDSLLVADRLLGLADLVPLVEPFARTIRSYALLELGEEAQSISEGERAQSMAAPFGLWQCLLLLKHVDGLRLLRAGRFTDASLVYAELEMREQELGIAEPCTVPYARHAVVAHVRAGRIREAERVVERLEEHARRLACRWPAAAAAAGRAVLAVQGERPEKADKQFRIALDALDGEPTGAEQAEVLIDHGTMLRHTGRRLEARESFRRAGELAGSVGATWLARRAGEELAAAGGRRVTRRAAHDLTPQEQRIARLAATGASNKDIATHLGVSVRTVRSHLEHIYAKLAIHSRRELMTIGERGQTLERDHPAAQ